MTTCDPAGTSFNRRMRSPALSEAGACIYWNPIKSDNVLSRKNIVSSPFLYGAYKFRRLFHDRSTPDFARMPSSVAVHLTPSDDTRRAASFDTEPSDGQSPCGRFPNLFSMK